MKELFKLFWIFAKIGSFTFGGGYAMLPMIKRELVETRNFATEDEVLDYYAIGQLTPGVIAVNVSTFIGYKRKGLLGAIFATAGMVFPSLVIITVIAALISNFQEIAVVKSALAGIRLAVLAMIVKTVIGVTKKGVVDKFTLIIMIATLLIMLLGFPAALITAISIAAGIAYKSVKGRA